MVIVHVYASPHNFIDRVHDNISKTISICIHIVIPRYVPDIELFQRWKAFSPYFLPIRILLAFKATSWNATTTTIIHVSTHSLYKFPFSEARQAQEREQQRWPMIVIRLHIRWRHNLSASRKHSDNWNLCYPCAEWWVGNLFEGKAAPAQIWHGRRTDP